MRKRHRLRSLLTASLIGCVLASTGCVDPFGGAHLTMTFATGVQSPAADGAPSLFGRPLANTTYTIYSVDFVHQRDADGKVVKDADGDPVVEKSYAHSVFEFEILPGINTASPCFIELDGDRFPGLHVTQVLAKQRELTGIQVEDNPDDPANGGNTTIVDYIDVIGARDRVALLSKLSTELFVVVDASQAVGPGANPEYPLGTLCADDPASDPAVLPPNSCIDEESNVRRLAICSDFWSRPEHKDYYEGSDKVYSLPLSGLFRGVVSGNNPKNGGPISGAAVYVPSNLVDFDALIMNWQFKDSDCPNGRVDDVAAPGCDGEPDYPAGTDDADKSVIGTHYMAGTPEQYTRGVTRVSLKNRVFPLINAEIAVFPEINEDNVHF